MQQWEYLGVRLVPESEHGRITVLDPLALKGTSLNELGRKGWEVVGVFRDNSWVLLKRPLEAQPTGATAPDANAAEPTSARNLPPAFGLSDEDRQRELEQKLQQELQRRRGGGNK